MIIKGSCNSAVIYADNIGPSAEGQIRALCNQAFSLDSNIRIMPDCHAGKGSVVGLTMTIKDKICPNLVGVDIGCGMEAIRFRPRKELDFDSLDAFIHKNIPAGGRIREKAHPRFETLTLSELKIARHVNMQRSARSLGTLGGGNHFIEVAKGDTGYWLIIHSGSRYTGVEVAGWYQKMAWELCPDSDAPFELAWFDGDVCSDYLHDMDLTQGYAAENRNLIADIIIKGMKWSVEERFTTVHNYIDIATRILRKGAISAGEGEQILIPLNMRDGSLLCRGMGNSEWNFSAPHGAGRRMTRTEAKGSFTLPEYKKAMKGIYSSCINRETIDESPMAYKSAQDIICRIHETAEIIDTLVPLYNFKAGG